LKTVPGVSDLLPEASKVQKRGVDNWNKMVLAWG
jgi:hypothetical protein